MPKKNKKSRFQISNMYQSVADSAQTSQALKQWRDTNDFVLTALRVQQ